MKKTLIRSACVAALLASSAAFAADLPARSAPAAPVFVPPAFTWTGFYVGGNIGYAFSDNSTRYVGNAGLLGLVGAGTVPGAYAMDADGFTGGLQAGYNHQWGSFVAGIEADFNYMDGSKTNQITVAAPGITVSGQATGGVEWLGTVRARLGFAADRFLVYATGGLAYGDVNNSGSIFVTGGGGLNGAFWSGTGSEVQVGWTLGAGFEYAFTNNITFGAEYLYYDLGGKSTTINALNAPAIASGVFAVQDADTAGSIVRARVNYKF